MNYFINLNSVVLPSSLAVTIVFIVAFMLPIWSSFSCYFADKRGRSGVIWFFLGMFLNFLSLPLLFWLPKKEAKKKIDYSKSWTCPHCWEVNDCKSDYCSRCGRKRPAEKAE